MDSKDNILFKKIGVSASSYPDAAHNPERLFPHLEEFSELSVTCHRSDFSASRISHAVEDADAHLLNMNVTSENAAPGQIIIDLRISHRDAGAASRSLERYGFRTIRITSGNDMMSAATKERIGALLAQIDV